MKAKRGVARQTWQAIAELGQYNYVMEESDTCGVATRWVNVIRPLRHARVMTHVAARVVREFSSEPRVSATGRA